MDRHARPIARLPSAVLLASVCFAAACGSETVAVDSAGTTTQARSLESSEDETSTVVFGVVAEDLPVGQPYSVAVISDHDAFRALEIDDPGIDFATDVVLVFDLAESSSPECQFRPVSRLVYDEPHQVLYPLVLMKGQNRVGDPIECQADANPHRIVLSVARTDLPPSHFSLWINGDDPPACCTDRVVFVAEGELTRLNGEFPPLDASGTLAIGETRILYGVSTHCGVDPIAWVIDGSQWTAVDPSIMSGIDPMPDGWARGDSQVIDLVLERTAPDKLTATALGTDVSVEYERSTERYGCD